MDNEYCISISKEKFEVLKNDRKFLKILILTRFINGLRFCLMSSFLPVSDREGTYARKRQTINGFLFTASVLYEGFRFAEQALKEDFQKMDVYKEGIGAMIEDKKIKELRETLRIMRNIFVFHFDTKNIQRTGQSLQTYNSDSYIFASAHGEASGNMYYVFADEFFINFLLDEKNVKSKDGLIEIYKGLLKDTRDLMSRFIEAAEKLIDEVLLEMGLTVTIAK
jgi:hypothetical protein